MALVKFDDQMLDYLQIIHDRSGPRSAFAFYLGYDNYLSDTKNFETSSVEDFIINFYTQYNRRYGVRY